MRNTTLVALLLASSLGVLLAQDVPNKPPALPEPADNLFDVRSASAARHYVNLIPAETVHARPGALIDMSDPGLPRPLENLRLKCGQTKVEPSSLVFSGAVVTNGMSSSEEDTAIRVEASFLSFFGGRMRINKEQFRQAHSNTVYGFHSVIDGSQAVDGRVQWDPATLPLPKPGGKQPARLTEFVRRYGTHYVHRIYTGRTIIFKAVINEGDEKRREEVEVALKAAFLGFKLGDSGYVKKLRERLKDYKLDVKVAVIGGVVDKPNELFVTSLDGLEKLMDNYAKGLLKVQSGPVGLDVYSLAYVTEDDDINQRLLGAAKFTDPGELDALRQKMTDRLLAAKIDFDYPGTFEGALRFGELSSGKITIAGTLANKGSLSFGDYANGVTINVGRPNTGDDLEGKIVIGRNCKGIVINVVDVVDATARIEIGDNSDVTVNVGKKVGHRDSQITAGKGCKLTIPDSLDFKTQISVGENTVVQKKPFVIQPTPGRVIPNQ